MYIDDYIKYYKNVPLNHVSWNIMDNLICSILVYLPIKSFKLSKNLKELKQLNHIKTTSVMAPKAIDLLDKIVNAKRYKDLKINDFTVIKNEKTQFTAATFKTNNETIIAFEGTDGSVIGWHENFKLAYEYPTYTQTLAIKYLEDNVKITDNNVYVVGHSKGGNLAMASVLECNSLTFNKIINVCNFDGPGFRYEQFNSEKYKRLSKKLINIIPTNSFVGSLLNNKNYTIVTSKELGFYQHDPTTWNIFGQFFIEGKLSSMSKKINESTINATNTLDKEKLKQTVEAYFNSFEKKYDDQFSFNFNDVKTFMKNAKNIDKNVATYILTVLESLINLTKND